MRKDQIFVLLMIVLFPLSGCLENGIGEAEAEEVTSVALIHRIIDVIEVP